MGSISLVLVFIAYLLNPILCSFEPWSCENLNYLPLSDLAVGHKIMVTEQGIEEAYCSKIIKIDDQKSSVELENGAVFNFGNEKAKMSGNNMNCDIQCSMNKMQQQMMGGNSFSKSMSWSRSSSWSSSGSSRKTAKKAQNIQNSQNSLNNV